MVYDRSYDIQKTPYHNLKKTEMKNLKYLFIFIAFLSIGLTSCTKEDVTNEEIENPTNEPETGISNPLVDNLQTRSGGSDEGCELACFSINYPFSLDIDGEVVELTSNDDLLTALEGLEEATFIDFVYPLEITYDTGDTETIADADALGQAFATCVPDDGWTIDSTVIGEDLFPAFLITTEESCFDLVYPVTLVDLEGNTSTVDSEAAFIELLADTEYGDILFFTFPLTISNDDGEQVVNTSDELFSAFASCWGDGTGVDSSWSFGGEIACYGVEFPFSVIVSNGNTVVVNNHDELCALMVSGTIDGYVYPLTLIDGEGNTIVINSDEELQDAVEDCWDGGVFIEPDFTLLILIAASNDGASPSEGCFDIVYPVSLVYTDGTVQEVGTFAELTQVDFSTGAAVSYPFSVVPNSTGDVTEVTSFEDLEVILEDCE